MFRKKFIISAVSLSLAASSLTGCGSGSSSKSGVTGSGDGLKIVCTIFPEYDWVKEILGSHADSADVTYLLDSGADLHSYQPTADDILQISTCDIFVYVGGESEKWVDDALDEPYGYSRRFCQGGRAEGRYAGRRGRRGGRGRRRDRIR